MGYLLFAICVVLIVISNVFSISANIWLAKWANAAENSNVSFSNTKATGIINNDTVVLVDNDYYLGIYATLGLSQGF